MRLDTVDAKATGHATHKRPPKDVNLLNVVRTGAAFAKDALYHTGQVEDQLSDFCGFQKQTIDHILWDCPCFAEVREQIDPGVAKWAPIMPACVRAGIAPIMTASLGTTFWGDR